MASEKTPGWTFMFSLSVPISNNLNACISSLLFPAIDDAQILGPRFSCLIIVFVTAEYTVRLRGHRVMPRSWRFLSALKYFHSDTFSALNFARCLLLDNLSTPFVGIVRKSSA
jgi:hypothetical protein